jgi:hypothetical protein
MPDREERQPQTQPKEEKGTQPNPVVRDEAPELGIGADLFIRKKLPGSKVGRGYVVDVYENGVKMDTLELKGKKDVIELVKKFKEKYRTDRAFQNESQVRITYKVEETDEDKASKTPKSLLGISRVPEAPEVPGIPKVEPAKGETTMAEIDNILLKQANSIQSLLLKILNPELPLKVRLGQEGQEQQPQQEEAAPPSAEQTVIPTTPGVGENEKQEVKSNIANQIMTKVVEFINSKYEKAATSFNINKFAELEDIVKLDDLYNPLKSWFAAIRRAIEDWNKRSENPFTSTDYRDIADELKKTLASGDIELISKNTGMQISQEVADKIKELALKSVSTEKGVDEDAEEGGKYGYKGQEALAQKGKAAAETPFKETAQDKILKASRKIQTIGDSTSIDEIMKELDYDREETMQEMLSYFNTIATVSLNASEATLKRWLEEKHQGMAEEDHITASTKEFWKYAENTQEEASLQNVFIDWLSENNKFSSEEVLGIWNTVRNDIEGIIFKKATVVLSDSDIQNVMHTFAAVLVNYLIDNINQIASLNSDRILQSIAHVIDNAISTYIINSGNDLAGSLVSKYQETARTHLEDIIKSLSGASIGQNITKIMAIIVQDIKAILDSTDLTTGQKEKILYVINNLNLPDYFSNKWNEVISNPETVDIFKQTIEATLMQLQTQQ